MSDASKINPNLPAEAQNLAEAEKSLDLKRPQTSLNPKQEDGYQNQSRLSHQNQPNPPVYGRKMQTSPEPPREQTQHRKPLPPEPTLAQMRTLFQSNTFKGPLKDSALYQKLEEPLRFADSKEADFSFRHDTRRLDTQQMGRLFGLRHDASFSNPEKQALKSWVRYEVAEANQNKKESALAKSERGLLNTNSSSDPWLKKLSATAESVFEMLLKKALGGQGSAVADLPEGDAPTFLVKSSEEWKAFFENVTKLSSALVSETLESQQVLDLKFRGFFESMNQLKLVGDLSFNQEGGEYKFAQILLKDPKILDFLQNLKPGQSLPRELLDALGNTLNIIKLLHAGFEKPVLNELEQQQILRDYKKQTSGNPRFLEEEFKKSRKLHEKFVGVNDTPKMLEERKGLQTVILYLFYAMLSVGFIFGAYVLLTNFIL